MYDPQIGRFWQQDPLEDVDESWSLYSFVNDNPVSFNDPLGLTDSSTLSTAKKPQELTPVVVSHLKKGCKKCDAPDPSKSAGAAPAGIPALPINPLTVVGPPAKIIEIGTVGEASAGLGLLAILGRVVGTVGGVLIPTPAPAEGLHWEPYVGHGNNKDNSNPHIVYAFGFAAKDGRTPILKYGISDEYKWSLDRPENQLAGLRAKYGPTVMMSIYTRTISRNMALYIERRLVTEHVATWKEMPREQDRPSPFP
jgi:hypothetical protein